MSLPPLVVLQPLLGRPVIASPHSPMGKAREGFYVRRPFLRQTVTASLTGGGINELWIRTLCRFQTAVSACVKYAYNSRQMINK